MLTAELEYSLPPQLIAQEPATPRDAARLLRLCRSNCTLEHRRVDELPQILRRGDLLVFNDTRVLRARLKGQKITGGGRVEALLLREVETNLWEALLKPSARLRVGALLRFTSPDGATQVDAELVERSGATWRVLFRSDENIRNLLSVLGEVPVPPYIKSAPREESWYQTTFARNDKSFDSAAAPTAGLHFTPPLLAALRACGISTCFITLGVGIGTFRPIQTATLEEHKMHEEEFEISPGAAQVINQQKQSGGRVIAVGTTTTRVLESAADARGCVPAGGGSTSIFIRPGYRFRCIDALLTNFHLPHSTLLAMVAAFAENATNKQGLTGLEIIRYAYSEAIRHRYRFFSFGDAMLIE